MYPPEILNYSIRANGVALSQLMLNCFAVLLVFLMPIGLNNIGWKMYMINGGWDIIVVVLIASVLPNRRKVPNRSQAIYWVETKGKTLEEIDALFYGQKHSDVPDVEAVRQGRETLSVDDTEKELNSVVEAIKSE